MVEKDYQKLILVNTSLPQSSLIYTSTEKLLSLTYERFIRFRKYFKSNISLKGSLNLDFNSAANFSKFFDNNGFTNGTGIQFGGKLFLEPRAIYQESEKVKLNDNYSEAIRFYDRLYNDVTSKEKFCASISKIELITKDSAGFANANNCNNIDSLYKVYLNDLRQQKISGFINNVKFSTKIYRWVSVDIGAKKPSISYVAFPDSSFRRFGEKEYSNSNIEIAYNRLLIKNNKGKTHIVSKLNLSNSENTKSLRSITITELNNFNQTANNISYRRKETTAYDSAKINKNIYLTLGMEYYKFFNKFGVESAFQYIIDENRLPNIGNEINLRFGLLIPFANKEGKTKTLISLFLNTSNNSKKRISSKYTSYVGFRVGVPLQNFAE